MAEIVIWGGSAHARVIAEALGEDHTIVAFFDWGEAPSPIAGVPIYCGEDAFDAWLAAYPAKDNLYGVCAIGGTHGAARVRYLDLFKSRGLKLLTVRHPTAYVPDNTIVGEGCHIFIKSIIEPGVTLGRGVIINSGAVIGHDVVIGDGAHITATSVIGGRCVIGENTFLGLNTLVLPDITIGKNVVVGAGSVVTRDVPDNVTVAGTPARLLAKK